MGLRHALRHPLPAPIFPASSPTLLKATSLDALSSTRMKPTLALDATTTASPMQAPISLAHTPTRTGRRRRPRPSSAPRRAISYRLAAPTTAVTLSSSRRGPVPFPGYMAASPYPVGRVDVSPPTLTNLPAPRLHPCHLFVASPGSIASCDIVFHNAVQNLCTLRTYPLSAPSPDTITRRQCVLPALLWP